MTLYIILAVIFIIFGVLNLVDNRKQQVATRNSAAIHAANKAREEREKKVAALEAEIFGVGKDISSLPGCHWKIVRGFQWESNDGTVHREEGLTVCLMDEDQKELGRSNVRAFEHPIVSFDSYVPATRRSMEKMEEVVQTAMRNLVKKEIQKRTHEANMNTIIEKYNGKAVVQDEVTL